MKTRANQPIRHPTSTVGELLIRNPQSAIRPVLRSFSGGGNPPSFAQPTEGRQSAIRNPQSAIRNRGIRNAPGIALVITLLMLSVITFLAVAFLVLTRTHRDQVNASLDVAMSQDMSRAALARAQSQIIARMKAHTNILNYDYMVSQNFINPSGFNKTTPGYDPTNVNYDFDTSHAPMSNASPRDWAQNIANLWLDPRPPVFVRGRTNTDFRFWLDLNRNGKFETNGYQPFIKDNGQPLVVNNVPVTNYFNGEPEWIGVLQYPEWPHSPTNRFIGRYIYMVLPIGKTLDFNYIHNYSKRDIVSPTLSANMQPATDGSSFDGYVRNQGVGSWELNLAGFLWGLDTNCYATNSGPYSFVPFTAANSGYAFNDAYSFLRYRCAANYGNPYPLSLSSFFAPYSPNYVQDGIDEYGILSLFKGSYPLPTVPWPGGYTTNNFYNIQDVFDTNKTSPGFVSRLLTAGSRINSYDRYMFQRLLAGIGTGSAPELQTWVYADGITTNPALQLPTLLRTKVNINYDNTHEITNGLNTSPTNLIPWTAETNGNPFGFTTNGALGFFTNAAEILLRSQNFRITNYDANGFVILTNPVSYLHFGVTNIPIYSSTNPSIRYTEQIHRMLQLAANIYDATRGNSYVPGVSLPYPSVFRPLFLATNYGGTNQALFIVGYTNVTTDAYTNILFMSLHGLKLPSDTKIAYNDNVWGVPWVIGAVKGLPAFNRFVADTTWILTRKLLFQRVPAIGNPYFGNPNVPPKYTNQFLIMSVSNSFGIEAWNAYQSNITAPCRVMASMYVSILLTNNSRLNPGWFATSFTNVANTFILPWSGVGQVNARRTTNGMLAFLLTNVASRTPAYFSESAGTFLPVHGSTNSAGFGYDIGTFRPGDLAQTNWPLYNWTLAVTNQVMYALVDPFTSNAFDFVNLGPFGTNYVLTNLMYSGLMASSPVANMGGSTTLSSTYWNSAPAGPGLPSIGVLNQISNGVLLDSFFASELNPPTNNQSTLNSNLFFSCSNYMSPTFPPQTTNSLYAQTLLVNDPLVHYTVGDLTVPAGDGSQILTYNDRYEPWPYNSTDAQGQTVGANMTFKDPEVFSSDSWNFPTNEFPSIGWLGRVHRGTPWQTIFLKADPDPVSSGVHQNQQEWITSWVSTPDTYPTNDYVLLDLFTAAPNDNAARGLLSVNQTSDAPWYAVLAGVTVNTNITNPHMAAPAPGPIMVYDPTNIAPLLDGPGGINPTRSLEPDQVFHSLASVFKSPMLTIRSPFLPAGVGAYTDDQVEAIPQQVAGLLKLGQPQFVIYAFGQALKPRDIYFGPDRNFNLVTNYQITGEFVTRAVCHVVGDPAAASVKIQVDNFNILPAD